jgi:hypothetical protein
LEFNDDLQLVAKKMVRYPLDVRELKRPFLSKYNVRSSPTRDVDARSTRWAPPHRARQAGHAFPGMLKQALCGHKEALQQNDNEDERR